MTKGGSLVVKRNGRRPTETFQRSKLVKSITSACLSAGAPQGQAETVAEYTANDVEKWLQQRPEVTSQDIRRIAGKHLEHHHREAGYLYQQHRITL